MEQSLHALYCLQIIHFQFKLSLAWDWMQLNVQAKTRAWVLQIKSMFNARNTLQTYIIYFYDDHDARALQKEF